MELFLLNLQWMAFNTMLAAVGMCVGWIAIKSRGIIRLLSGALWFLFIPNTIYMVTDLAHLSWQLPAVDPIMWLPIIMQFLLLATLGVVTFVLGFYPFELFLHRLREKGKTDYTLFIILLMNLLIGFGVILGRVYRIHSWYVLTQTHRVLVSAISFLSSFQLVAIALTMGIVSFIVYFLLRDEVARFVPKKLRKT